MSELKICRVCLRTEVKVYKYDEYYLKSYYEEVIAMRMDVNDGLPHYFCYECATLLHNFHKFKEKCYMGQKVLKEMLWGGSISYKGVYKIDREEKHLISPLKILTVNNRVKTYTTKDSTPIPNTSEKPKGQSFESMTVDNDDDFKFDSECDDRFDVDEKEATIEEEEVFIKELIVQPAEKEKTEEEIEQTIEVPGSCPSSPTTVFVDVKKEVVQLKNQTIKSRAPAKKKRFQSRTKKQFLDENNWKKMSLTEEEAVKEFRAKADDPKYVAAENKCTDCFKWFSKKEILDRHKKLRHDETLKQDCRFCHMRFKWDCKLRKHMVQHYSRFICLRCGLVCNIEHTALLHEASHNGVTQTCVHCGEEFRHLSTYYTHMRTHRSEYICTLCGASFVSALGLHQHKKVKHVDDLHDVESPDDDEEVNTYCERCDIRFETRKAFEEHLFHSANHTEAVDDKMLEEIYKDRKVLGKKLKAVITTELRKRRRYPEKKHDEFKGTIARRKYYSRKKVKKPTTCHQCGKHFDTQAACMKHHLAEHPRTSFFPASERHICEICGASLAPGSVPTHRNMHSRETVHSCDTCGRQFHSSVGLKRHLVTHTGEKPFGCTLCDKRFTQSNSMKLHYRTFHLKQPYPKRNRRKKKEDGVMQENTAHESRSEESEESMQELKSLPDSAGLAIENHVATDNIHYLTLD